MKTYLAILATAIILGMTAIHGEWLPESNTRHLASEDITEDPSYLSDFDYRLTDVGGDEAVDELYNVLTDDLDRNPNNVCHYRAHMWAYQMQQLKNINSGKILLIYGKDRDGDRGAYGATGHTWWFHIAPYVISEGKEIVMEKMFDLNSPTPMRDWISHMTGGRECKILDGTGSETAVYEYMLKSLSVPVSEGGYPCYIRKIPMGFLGPQNVYNHDILKTNYSNDLTRGYVMSACLNSFAGKRKVFRKKLCKKFLTNPVDMFQPKPEPEASPSPVSGNE